LYLYAVTSGKNGYDFNLNNFISAAQRYGFDAPFPFLHMCSKMKKVKNEEEVVVEVKTTEMSETKGKASRI